MAKLWHALLGLLVFIVFAALVLLQHSQLSAAFTGTVNSFNHEHPMVNNILLKDQHLRAVAALASSVNSLEGRGDEKKSEVQVGEAKMEPPPEVVANADEIKSPLASVASSVETLRRVVGGPLTSEEVLAQLSASDSIELSSVPDDTVTTVVSCATSKGNITIDIRRDWGPNGVDRYLDLVRANYFDDLPFFRVCPRYITQFGVKHVKAGDARPKCSSLNDDPSLWGIRDMDTGYLFYAGSGARSRGCQMVLALCDMPGCKQTTLGTTFWEVPIGTVRKEGHGVLKDIAQTGFPYPKLEMGGQHKDAGGPNQGLIAQDPDYLGREYPDMAYWRGCRIVEDGLRLKRPLIIDYPGTTYYIPSKPNIPRLTMANMAGGAPIPLDSSGHITSKLPRVFVEFTIVIKEGADSSATPAAGQQEYVLVVEVLPDWSPLGASRLVELVSTGYFTNMVFFRVLKNFMAQFGISSTRPAETRHYQGKPIPDEPIITPRSALEMRNRTALFTQQYPRHSNSRGTISYAMGGPGSRSCQLFINLVDNKFLDAQGFTPIARIVYGALGTKNAVSDSPGDVNIIDRIYNGYGEGGKGDGSDGKGPGQGWLLKDVAGSKRDQIDKFFPKLSYIKHARIL